MGLACVPCNFPFALHIDLTLGSAGSPSPGPTRTRVSGNTSSDHLTTWMCWLWQDLTHFISYRTFVCVSKCKKGESRDEGSAENTAGIRNWCRLFTTDPTPQAIYLFYLNKYFKNKNYIINHNIVLLLS